MKDWKTTLFGALAAVSTAMATQGPVAWQGYAGLAVIVFGSLFAFFAKDKTPAPKV